jgi:hypothetical protein
MNAATTALLTTLLFAAITPAQDPNSAPARPSTPTEEKEPAAIIELGAAGEWALTHGRPSYGPNLAVEVTPIPEWLEIEAGVTPFFSRGQTEWDTDLLFKKPFTLSRTVEFMPGLGPEWAHTSTTRGSSNAFAAEAAADFMYWPSPHRRFGWYLEPSYAYSFAGGHEQSISVTLGFLIAIP